MRPFKRFSDSTANVSANWAAVFSSLLKIWPSIHQRYSLTLYDSFATLHLLYKVLLLIIPGYLMLSILLRCCLCVTEIIKVRILSENWNKLILPVLLPSKWQTDTLCPSQASSSHYETAAPGLGSAHPISKLLWFFLQRKMNNIKQKVFVWLSWPLLTKCQLNYSYKLEVTNR